MKRMKQLFNWSDHRVRCRQCKLLVSSQGKYRTADRNQEYWIGPLMSHYMAMNTSIFSQSQAKVYPDSWVLVDSYPHYSHLFRANFDHRSDNRAEKPVCFRSYVLTVVGSTCFSIFFVEVQRWVSICALVIVLYPAKTDPNWHSDPKQHDWCFTGNALISLVSFTTLLLRFQFVWLIYIQPFHALVYRRVTCSKHDWWHNGET